MQNDIVSMVFLPLALSFIMFSLGLGLTTADFRDIVRQPRALLVGVVCHFVLLPVIAWYLVRWAGLPPAIAVGFMIVAACPTGTTSNLLTYIARGDVALAVSFTAVASVLTVFTLPLIVSAAMDNFMGHAVAVAVPVPLIMAQVFLLLALPVGAGMGLRGRWPERAKAFAPLAARISTVLFFAIMGAAVVKNWKLLHDSFAQLAPIALGLNAAMLAIGLSVAWLVRLPTRQAVTLGIESAIQNAALALVIAGSVLHNDEMVIPAAVYGILMYVGGVAFAFGMRRFTGVTSKAPVSGYRAGSSSI